MLFEFSIDIPLFLVFSKVIFLKEMLDISDKFINDSDNKEILICEFLLFF